MFSSVWNYFSGYVIIKIEGLGLERFVNHALKNSLHIWHVKRLTRTALTANIGIRDFYRLHRLKKSLHCRITIISKHGLPFLFTKYRFRKVLLFGWVAVIALMITAARFVWFIDIKGCYKVQEQEIRVLLKSADVYQGMSRHDINTMDIGLKLMMSDERIAWAGVGLNGVVLSVEIVETQAMPDLLDLSLPTGIYAAKEAVITGITPLKGKALVKNGDAVKKGELLITGDLRTEAAPELLVHAIGEVTGKVVYHVRAIVDPVHPKLSRSGRSGEYVQLSVKGYNIINTPPEFMEYELEPANTESLERIFLPLLVTKGTCYELELKNVELSESELTQIALLRAQAKLDDIIPKDSRLLSCQSETTLLENGSVLAAISVCAEETIGEMMPLQYNNLPE